jgi:hypothetical protein
MAKTHSRAGDLVFFAILIGTVSLAVSAMQSLSVIFTAPDYTRLLTFFSGIIVGGLCCLLLIRGHLSVLLHELKHAIVALLAGNSPKGIKIGRSTGHFAYSFTEDTKSYNAFIYLAPYTLPLFTVCLLASCIYPLWHEPLALLAIVGLGYGIDVVSGIRDIHPGQTDFSSLYGGFGIGIVYVTALHILMFFSLLAWAAGGVPILEAFCKSIFGGLFS